MSIIKLKEPWAFFADESKISEEELEELQKSFVDSSNDCYSWETDRYNGITGYGKSNYFSDIASFDEYDIEENVTVYTIEQLRDIIAEHLAKQPVDKLEDGVVYYVVNTESKDKTWLAVNNVSYVHLNKKFLEKNSVSWTSEFKDQPRYTFTKATPEQIAHYEACVKAGKYIEPESVTQFVVGKWYKWFQKDHGREQKGKCANLYDSHFEMKPWICHSSKYVESGMFNLRDAESIELIEDLSEIQDLLPDGHPDKGVKATSETITTEAICETCNGEGIVMVSKLYPSGHTEVDEDCPDCDGNGFIEEKVVPKSERYLATMKFFEQLREPERSEAIANYDEDYGSGTKVPKDLAEAINYGFKWSSTKQEHEYWMVIKDEIMSGIYFQEEPLVFGKYKVGDIVVRTFGEPYLYKIAEGSTKDCLRAVGGVMSDCSESWRPATPEEVKVYNKGFRNVANIEPKDYKEAVHCTTQEEWDFVLSKFNNDDVWPKSSNMITSSSWSQHKKDSYINTERGSFGDVNGTGKDWGYTILTFKQWCEKYGHSYEVVPEYVECTYTSSSREFTVGKIYTWPKPVDNEGSKRTITTLNGPIWKFKPSTKEAYNEQQEKFKMEDLLSEPKPTKIKPAKGMHVRCLKENNWSDGKTKAGQVFVIEDVDWSGDMWVNNNSFAKERLGRGDFELLPDYKEEPWVAQVGDWVYVLDRGTACMLKEGEIRKCVQVAIVDEEIAVSEKQPGYWLKVGEYRKATQEEIDSVTKPEKKDSIFEQLRESMFDSDMAWHKLHSTIEKHKPQQDELVIYKPKRVIL